MLRGPSFEKILGESSRLAHVYRILNHHTVSSYVGSRVFSVRMIYMVVTDLPTIPNSTRFEEIDLLSFETHDLEQKQPWSGLNKAKSPSSAVPAQTTKDLKHQVAVAIRA